MAADAKGTTNIKSLTSSPLQVAVKYFVQFLLWLFNFNYVHTGR